MKNFKSLVIYFLKTENSPVFFRILYILLLIFFIGCKEKVSDPELLNTSPKLYPNYVNVTIPPNIAPLSFKITETDYTNMDVIAEGSHGTIIHEADNKSISFNKRHWEKLLKESVGDSINICISYKNKDKWFQYKKFQIYISRDSIDPYLTYRLIAPGYEVYSKMGIYQRNISTYSQNAIIENTLVTGSCVNCHSYCNGNPGQMSFHVRGKFGGTVLIEDSILKLLKTKTDQTISKFVYPYWHPSGRYIAYSLNNTHQVFHTANSKKVEVYDEASDIIIYDVLQNKIMKNPAIMNDSVFETFPSFSPDGKYLYYCAAKKEDMPGNFQNVHYNLLKIAFNPDSGNVYGSIDTLFNAESLNKSVSFPRPSPDGKFLMFTISDYGNFSIWHKEADLYLMNLTDLKTNPLINVNSDDTESYHSWSSNSKWFVFSSRRHDGLYTRLYLAHLNKNGIPDNPFLLPQKDADYDNDLFYSYNIPEFIKSPVHLNIKQFEQEIYGAGMKVK